MFCCSLYFYPASAFYIQYDSLSISVLDGCKVPATLGAATEKLEPIPFYKDCQWKSVTLLGIQSYFENSIPTTLTVNERILISLDYFQQFVEILHQIIDTSASIKLMETHFKDLGADTISSKPLRIMGVVGAKKIGFFADLRDPWSTGNVNITTQFSNFFFKLVRLY
jgi:hypothetical protein